MRPERLRDLIKNRGSEISFDEYRLRYAAERFLLRLQESSYKDKLIIKGGFLMGTIYNVEQRMTKDLDALIKGMDTDKVIVKEMLEEIMAIDLQDGVRFELIDLLDSQKNRIYKGYRAKLIMFLGDKSNVIFDFDLGVGDVVTPSPRQVRIPLLFNEKNGEKKFLTLLSYPLETILAEKTEIILSLGTENTRMKDFYDLHLMLNDPERPPIEKRYQAFLNTWNFRHGEISDESFEDWEFILEELSQKASEKNDVWQRYIKDRPYAQKLRLEEIISEFSDYVIKLKEIYNKSSE